MFDPYVPTSGSIPIAVGLASVVRIPIPGTNGLAIEFRPRGPVPVGGSTSTLFFQDATGKRHLRLDYGYNPRTNAIDYHWNHRSAYADFGINNHAGAGNAGIVAYHAAKYFRYAGRVLVLVGAGLDVISIVSSDRPLRRASEVASAWSLAWVGCRVVGAGGAAVGTLASPLGTAIGGVGGCIIGGYAGYKAGSALGATVYDWSIATFSPLEQMEAP